MRICSCALVRGVASLIVLDARQQAPPRTYSSSADLVVVPAVVVDKRGQTVRGLAQDDFELREDGKAVTISTFVAADQVAAGEPDRRFVVILLDNLRTSATLAWRVKDIARRFARLMGPGDVVTVLKLDGDHAVTSTSRARALAAIDRFTPGGISTMPARLEAEHAMETISELARQMTESPHPRKVLVCIGSAWLFRPHAFDPSGARELEPEPEYSQVWHEAIRDTARQNVSVYVIDPVGASQTFAWGTGAPASDVERPRLGAAPLGFHDGAGSFAWETGGEAFLRTNDFDSAVRRIWDESASYYLLGYVPPVTDERVHAIEVRVKRPGLTVRARRARG